MAAADGTAWALAVWFVYLAFRMLHGGGWKWWPAAVVAGCLSATTKAPFFMVAGLTAFFWLLWEQRHSRTAWLQLASVGAASCLVFWAWSVHAQKMYDLAEFPLMNLSALKGGGVRSWYFGDLTFRLKISNWIFGGWHGMNLVMGNPGLTLLLLAGLRLRRTWPAFLWLAAATAATLVFTPLVLMHWHYFFIFSPAVALLCGCAAQEFEPAVWQSMRVGAVCRCAVLLLATVASVVTSLRTLHISMFFDSYKDNVAKILKQHTLPGDKLVVWGMVWSDPFMRAEREGFTGGLRIESTAWLEDSKKLERLKELGYTKLVLLNPSPFVVALTTETGTHASVTADLVQHVPAVAKNWPVVFNSPPGSDH